MLAFLGAILMSLSLVTPTYGADTRTVIPLGKAVGIKLFADGALVVAVEDSDVLQKGDLLLKLGGEEVSSIEEVQSLLRANGGAVMTMEVQRGERILSLADAPRQGADGVWRLGVWIR
ncbi:MAG: SpoIVB peptidase, partial [Oscillospiraceae bacterium]|nr:SpoIVB peptidase [Oscillospiraceae bacterium]